MAIEKKTWFVVKDKFSMRYSRRLSKVYGTWYHKLTASSRLTEAIFLSGKQSRTS